MIVGLLLLNTCVLFSTLKTCQFKTRCKGNKSNSDNSADHFCEDTRQNALAAITYLDHVAPIVADWTPSSKITYGAYKCIYAPPLTLLHCAYKFVIFDSSGIRLTALDMCTMRSCDY